MKLYEVEVVEENGRDAKMVADALRCLFSITKIDVENGFNGHPVLIVETPNSFLYERTFKLWLMERGHLTQEIVAVLDPLLEEADEEYLLLADGSENEKDEDAPSTRIQ